MLSRSRAAASPPPSPRVRGEGWGEGASPLGSIIPKWLQRPRSISPLRIAVRPLTLASHSRCFASAFLHKERRPKDASLSPRSGERYRTGAKPLRSRGTPLRPSVAHATVRKPVPSLPPKKEGGGAPISASTGVRPAAEKASLPATAARALPQPRTAELQERHARLSAPHRGHIAEGLTSTRFRAALPGITGCKREDPLRHQCSQHLAVRSRAGRSMPRTARIEVRTPLREPHPPHQPAVTGDVPIGRDDRM
jgi:hypothetical protein